MNLGGGSNRKSCLAAASLDSLWDTRALAEACTISHSTDFTHTFEHRYICTRAQAGTPTHASPRTHARTHDMHARHARTTRTLSTTSRARYYAQIGSAHGFVVPCTQYF
uniref:Uncharacterized protein n=1 Tax=Chrysotila carterae TaxID=13221 RepID=A0A6T0AV30_CHRCT|mmetsp:Transcript_28729/g.55536  ORF Transcript_28729/g.55536 Transcript_28729/m.55536 type:complete len:109 (-) Transcript_28729:127-453(-)